MSPRIAGAAIIIVFVSITFSACRQVGRLRSLVGKGGRHADRAVEAGGETQVLAGTVRLVRESLGFGLIQSSGTQPPPGSELTVHRKADRRAVATLRVSPERKTGFVVADILSGDPREGDSVLWSLPGEASPDLAAPANLADPGVLPTAPTFPGLPDAPMQIDPGPQRRVVPADGPVLAPEAELEREIRRGGGTPPLGARFDESAEAGQA